jgi:hypothetical protein
MTWTCNFARDVSPFTYLDLFLGVWPVPESYSEKTLHYTDSTIRCYQQRNINLPGKKASPIKLFVLFRDIIIWFCFFQILHEMNNMDRDLHVFASTRWWQLIHHMFLESRLFTRRVFCGVDSKKDECDFVGQALFEVFSYYEYKLLCISLLIWLLLNYLPACDLMDNMDL